MTQNIFFIFILIYGGFSLFHFTLQLVFALKDHKTQKTRSHTYHKKHQFPKISVIVPFYNEIPHRLKQCIESVYSQSYPKKQLEIWLINDGSTKYNKAYNNLFESYSSQNIKLISYNKNRGKRHAQYEAFEKLNGEIVVTIDSDTTLYNNALRQMIRNFCDPKVGAVTGEILVKNRRENFLTRLTHLRYWTAFHQERSAQSYFGRIVCCSGPFSAYRRNIIDEIKDMYISQTFRGTKCTFGDDRHLTNLVLNHGFDVFFDERAKALTYVPTEFRKWLKQQLRWSKSFFRELLWTSKFCPHCCWYMNIDIIAQTILPLLLFSGVIITLIFSAVVSPFIIIQYLLTIIIIGFIRSLYGLIKTKDPEFLLFALYAFLHALFLIPIRIIALCSLKRMNWGTR